MSRRRPKRSPRVPVERTVSSSVVDEEHPPPNVRKSLPCSSVVKIFTVTSRPNFKQPWQMGRLECCKGSGFVIHKKYILTNAHVVADYTTVQIRRHGGHRKFEAKVLCINHTCDLALLAVDSTEFWKNLPALEVADEVPQLDERVLVIGYPMGGDTISVTRGVVSRVTTLSYNDVRLPQLHSSALLVVQIDAAINSGNSGGPVFRENGQVVGVAFSGYAGAADNIGYIIPYPVIKNFLADYEKNGSSEGVCDLGFFYELCENKAMQKMLKLSGNKSGVRVVRVRPMSACHGIVKPGDVLMGINGHKVANDATIVFRGEERVQFQHAVSSHPLGEDMELELLRDGKKKTVTVKGMSTPVLIPRHRKDKEKPSYVIVGGAVFSPMTGGLLEAAVEDLDDDAWEYSRRPKRFPDEQMVVRVGWLSHPINHGYGGVRAERVYKCNGVKVRNIRHLKALIDKSKKFVCFHTGIRRTIAFDVKEAKKAEKEILETYAIPSACSKDLEDVDPDYEPVSVDTSTTDDNDDDSDVGQPANDAGEDEDSFDGVIPTGAGTAATGGRGSSRGRRGAAGDAAVKGDDNGDDDDDDDDDEESDMPSKRAKTHGARRSPRAGGGRRLGRRRDTAATASSSSSSVATRSSPRKKRK